MKTGLGDLLTYTYEKKNFSEQLRPERYFQGYRRKDGRAAVRNEVWIIPTVGCVNNVAQAIEKAAQKYITDDIDAVSYTHLDVYKRQDTLSNAQSLHSPSRIGTCAIPFSS